MMTIPVRLDATGDDLAERNLAILKDRIEQRSDAQVRKARDHADIVLSIRATLAGDAFAIADDGPAVRIVGGSSRGLLYGVGKFLRTSQYAGGFSLKNQVLFLEIRIRPSTRARSTPPGRSANATSTTPHSGSWMEGSPLPVPMMSPGPMISKTTSFPASGTSRPASSRAETVVGLMTVVNEIASGESIQQLHTYVLEFDKGRC